jgi:hypothetical protein
MLSLCQILYAFGPATTAYGQHDLRHLGVDQQYPPVKSTGWRPLPQGQPGCRTIHAKNLRPLDSFATGFSTFCTLLAFYRSYNPPYQILVEGPGGGWHVCLTLLRPPPARCPAHPLTDGSVWVSSPVPSPVSSTYSQYW